MATDINRNTLVSVLKSDVHNLDKFSILQEVSCLLNSNDELGRECILRILSRKKDFKGYEAVISSLLRQAGYFPYIVEDELSIRDAFAIEVHRPDGFREVVMHKAQADVYFSLMKGENVVLSAPTSFGKSLIVDMMIASGRYRNIMIVVPSIALIDEMRKRVAKYKDKYKVITHPSQTRSERNLYVFTQERAVEIVDDIEIDFFVIDEFYKLDEQSKDERCIILNKVFYSLLQKRAQFYMLGPNIEEVSCSISKFSSYKFIKSDFSTVVTETYHIKPKDEDDKFAKLVEILSGHKNQPTLIYCSSPSRANKLARDITETGLLDDGHNVELVKWLRTNYHEEWELPKNLEHGVGVHHGKTPRSIAQKIVQLFNNGAIKILVCTSTLIEGVNTSAKNVIVYDNKISTKKLDYFTFSNIKGRSGRMSRHLIGNIFVFADPPQPELPFVDIPILEIDDDSPTGLLVYLNDDDLSESSRDRIQKYKEQTILPYDTLKQNAFIDLDVQLEVAKEIEEQIVDALPLVSWCQLPNSNQLKYLCNKVWQLTGCTRKTSGVASGDQLYYRLITYSRYANNLKGYIEDLLKNDRSIGNPSDAVEMALDFQRQWLNFRLPREIKVFQNIVNAILSKHQHPHCDYSYYASLVECYFLKPYVVPLDEYGLPIQISMSISKHIDIPDGIDEAIMTIKHYKVSDSNLSPLEKEFVQDIQKYI